MATTTQSQGFIDRAKSSFATSSWLTAIWEWFLGLAARAVQPVLFVTVMYSIASTYPGFKSPGTGFDLAMFIIQNGALDVASFGLPKLADQAEREGNEDGANEARKVSKALFWIMISNLVYGGIDHIITGIPDGVKVGVTLIFVIIRAFYAIKYSVVIHGLKSEGHNTALCPVQVNQIEELRIILQQQIADQFEQTQKQLLVQMQLNKHQEDIDYGQIVSSVAPLMSNQIDSMKAIIIEEIKTVVQRVQFQQDSEHQPCPEGQSKMQIVSRSLEQIGRANGCTKVSRLDTNSSQLKVSNLGIEQSIRSLLRENPSLSGRAIASQIGCSPTTANNWKSRIEEEEKQGRNEYAI